MRGDPAQEPRIGCPDRVQCVRNRRVTKRTPLCCRNRFISDSIDPSLHFDSKRTHGKQFFKQGRALHTLTTINHTHEFQIGHMLSKLVCRVASMND